MITFPDSNSRYTFSTENDNYDGPFDDADFGGTGKLWTWNEDKQRWEPYLELAFAALSDRTTADLPAINTLLSEALDRKADVDDFEAGAGKLTGPAAPLTIGTAAAAALLDSDSMTGALATNVPSAESVKAYVDANAGGTVDTASVTTNALKLALTNIHVGQLVKITGEADRVEQFIGGAINDDDNWRIVGKNTVALYYDDSNGYNADGAWSLNGVVPAEGETTFCGWIDPSEPIAMTNSTLANFFSVNSINSLGINPHALNRHINGASTKLFLPSPLPPRATVIIAT